MHFLFLASSPDQETTRDNQCVDDLDEEVDIISESDSLIDYQTHDFDQTASSMFPMHMHAKITFI